MTVVEPGTFPPDMLDQADFWIAPDGNAYNIANLDEESVMWAIDYALANAYKVRNHYAIGKQEPYDEKQRPRQWMLDRVAVRALMRRLVALDDEKKKADAKEEWDMRYLTPRAALAIEGALDRWIFGG